jgi:hypothetical protein
MQFDEPSTPSRLGPGSPGQMRGNVRGMAKPDRMDINSEFEKLLVRFGVKISCHRSFLKLQTLS